jgi:tyrosinase
MTFLRKDAWKLSGVATWEPTLLWYAKAVGDMASRPASDPTSWRFQGGVHGYNKASDPLVTLGPAPTKTIQQKYWNKCQHGSWFFLPWHRMYLGIFEQAVRATVVKLGGPADWALPYWNYSDTSNPNARKIPPAFRAPTLPGGGANPLFAIGGVNIPRTPGINAGNAAAVPTADVDLTNCLGATFFSPNTAKTTGDLGFGGPATGANHRGKYFGPNSVESLPHNAIHNDVGGDFFQGGVEVFGWMIDPDTAALDPIFWLHHANIDRLWSVWSGSSGTHTNPAGPVNVHGKKITWGSFKFAFLTAGGNVNMTPSQVVDTTTSPFQYDYDVPAHAELAVRAAAATGKVTAMKTAQPEMVGGSKKKVTLTGTAQTTAFAIQEPTGPARARAKAEKAAPAGKTYLVIEHVTSKQSHETYQVYVNLPENADAASLRDHYAGAMHLFGVRHASRRSKDSDGNGLSFSLDITRLVERLKAENAWDAKRVRVTFAPRDEAGEASRAVKEHAPIQIGSVSLCRE